MGKRRSKTLLSGLGLFFFVFGLAGVSGGQDKPPAESAPTPAVTGVEKGPTPVMLTSPGIQADLHASVQLDYLGFDEGEQYINKEVGSQENNFSLRRGRITLRGRLWDRYGFYFQTAMEIPEDPLIDATMMIPVTEGIDFYAGKMKMPFSEERLKSFATHQPFMERSLVANLELRRSQGIMLVGHPGSGLVSLYLGCFTGENMGKPNTDDDFEFVGRVLFQANSTTVPNFPFLLNVGFSAARGRRAPIREQTYSFTGKTMNELVFFSRVPVNGYRTRYEADVDFRYHSFWLGGEWISSEEERNQVRVDLDTDGDGKSDDSVKRDLDPLREQGWMVYGVWYITGEPAGPNLTPHSKWGAVGLAVRYATITFETGEDRIRGSAPGTKGREVSAASQGLGRPSVNETVSDLYLGVDWVLHQGVFIQVAAVWQWFDESSPYYDDPHRHADINYRARVGMTF